jgi:hypothetical protein
MVTPNFTPYSEVLVILKRAGQADVDLSKSWSTIEYEDGLPQSVKITLNSAFGKFMTVAPIIVKYDKIFVKITDARDNVIQDVFHVRKIKRGRKIGKNKQLVLFCPHQSENLWTQTISLVAKRTSGADALNQIITILNTPQNKGADDPDVEVPANDTVRKVGNFLDENTSNNYIFEGVKLQTAVDEIREIEQQPIEGGGSFEAIFIRFKSKYDHDSPSDADLNTVQLQAFPQGFQDDGFGSFTNIPNVTLIHQPLKSAATPPTNILEFESDEDPELATNIHVIGEKSSGSYLVDWQQFQGAKDVFNNVKEWSAIPEYTVGNLVNEAGIIYECIADNTNNQPPNATFWIVRTFTKPAIWSFGTPYALNDLVRRLNISWKCIQAHMADNNNEPPNSAFWVRIFFAPAVDYSPLTKANTQNWVNALAGSQFAVDVTDVNQGRVCIVDPNVIVKDVLHPRTFVRLVEDDPANIPTNHKIAGVDISDGYRVLAIDPATGGPPLAGPWVSPNVDRNGVLFAGNIVEWIDTNLDGVGEWVVFKSKVLGDDQEIFDWYRAEPWIKNPCEGAGSYVDGAGVCQIGARATIWKIGSYAIQQIPLVGTFAVFFANRQVECAHSVKWDFTNHHIDMGTVKLIADDVDGDSGVFIKTEPTLLQGGADANPFFCGFNIHALWPLTGQDNAEFPGSGTAGSDIALPTFDFNNMFRDHFGVASWFGPQSEDYMPIQKFAFWLQFILTRNAVLGLVNLTEGDFSIGIWMTDRRDNVKIIEMQQPRKDEIFPQEGSLPGDTYTGVPGASTIFSPQEPETVDAFDPREFILGGIYTRDAFDKDGRYLGVKSRFNTTTEIEMRLDGYRFTKPLTATNADVLQAKPSRNISTQFVKQQNIISYAQLKNLALGLDKIFNFERREFKETVGGRCDVQFGDSVYYTDSEEINDTTDALPNTVKGVNTKNVISLSKGKNGPGGFTNKFDLVTRIWP